MSFDTPVARWRALALVVGTLLVVLVFVGVPLKYGAGTDAVAGPVGVTHGFLYMGYVLFTLYVGRLEGWTLKQQLLAILAGLIPIMTFVVERRVARGALLV